MKIIDNCISKELQDKIENYFLQNTFPWFYQAHSLQKDQPKKYKIESKNTFDEPKFTHIFVDKGEVNSSHIDIVIDLLKELKIEKSEILRCKANLKFRTSSKKLHNIFHVDSPSPHKVLIYYINDSDGDTHIKLDKSIKKISPKKGRALMFKGGTMHAANHPKKTSKRLVLNFNLK